VDAVAALVSLKGRLVHGKQVDLKFALALEEPDPAGEVAPRLRAQLRVGAASGDAWQAGAQRGQADSECKTLASSSAAEPGAR
jgi:hypothetical protein